MSVARSTAISGTYEADPAGPLVTSSDEHDWPLQKAGHGDIVETADGEFYLVHLVGRPLPGTRRCPLGRETAIQKLRLSDDGWFRLDGGGHLPSLETELPNLPPSPGVPKLTRDDFDEPVLASEWQWLRTPWPEEFMSLTDRPGYLRLSGLESPGSQFRQALVARRQVDFCFELETEVEFEPVNFQQLAGLVLYYNSRKFHYLYISTDSENGKYLDIMSCEADRELTASFPLDEKTMLRCSRPLRLRAHVDFGRLQFSWSYAGEAWTDIGPELDYSLLSDETGVPFGEQFTGCFVGVACHDVTGSQKHADFDFIRYEALG